MMKKGVKIKELPRLAAMHILSMIYPFRTVYIRDSEYRDSDTSFISSQKFAWLTDAFHDRKKIQSKTTPDNVY